MKTTLFSEDICGCILGDYVYPKSVMSNVIPSLRRVGWTVVLYTLPFVVSETFARRWRWRKFEKAAWAFEILAHVSDTSVCSYAVVRSRLESLCIRVAQCLFHDIIIFSCTL